MSDLFHIHVPDDYIREVFNIMGMASWHQFQILTKRAERMERLLRSVTIPDNVWIGVSVETPVYYARIRHLQRVQARIRFLSCEPLLAPLPSLPLDGIQWVIVGGESGPGARPVEAAWVEDILDQCAELAVPFFFKQWGGVRKKRAGRLLRGQLWNALPANSDASIAYV